jgi:hypothetical protein
LGKDLELSLVNLKGILEQQIKGWFFTAGAVGTKYV